MLLSRNSNALTLEDAANKSSAVGDNYEMERNEQTNMKSTFKQKRLSEVCCKLCGNYTKIVQTRHKYTRNEFQARIKPVFKCNKCCHITRSASVESITEETDEMGEEQDEVDDQATDRSGLDDEEDQVDIDMNIDDMDDMESAGEHRMNNEEQESDAEIEHNAQIQDETIRRMTKVEKDKNDDSATILKDTNTKPILKFSVSAILGDTREGVRVRNGKQYILLLFQYQQSIKSMTYLFNGILNYFSKFKTLQQLKKQPYTFVYLQSTFQITLQSTQNIRQCHKDELTDGAVAQIIH